MKGNSGLILESYKIIVGLIFTFKLINYELLKGQKCSCNFENLRTLRQSQSYL